MRPMEEEMRRAADACLSCHRVCLTTFSQHCLDVGGPHVEPRHTRLMLRLRRNLPHLRFLHRARHRVPQTRVRRLR